MKHCVRSLQWDFRGVFHIGLGKYKNKKSDSTLYILPRNYRNDTSNNNQEISK